MKGWGSGDHGVVLTILSTSFNHEFVIYKSEDGLFLLYKRQVPFSFIFYHLFLNNKIYEVLVHHFQQSWTSSVKSCSL